MSPSDRSTLEPRSRAPFGPASSESASERQGIGVLDDSLTTRDKERALFGPASSESASERQGIGVLDDSLTSRDEERAKRNRANAQHSTGPRTPEGKARSSRNAITHGLFAKHAVIRGEDADEFNALHEGFVNSLHPEDDGEEALVFQMANAAWRQRRIDRVEVDIFEAAFIDAERRAETDETVVVSAAAAMMGEFGRGMDRVNRAGSRATREFSRALRDLLAVRKQRNADVKAALEVERAMREEAAAMRTTPAPVVTGQPVRSSSPVPQAAAPWESEEERPLAAAGRTHVPADRVGGITKPAERVTARV